jgi:hypothetical protein
VGLLVILGMADYTCATIVLGMLIAAGNRSRSAASLVTMGAIDGPGRALLIFPIGETFVKAAT